MPCCDWTAPVDRHDVACARDLCKGSTGPAAQWLDAACRDRPIHPFSSCSGLDAGHLLDVLDERAPSTKVLALEPDRAMADAFLARRDWSSWLASGRLAHLVHPDNLRR